MKKRICALLGLVFAAPGMIAYAHHSFAPLYDAEKIVRIEGRLISFSFRSPHSIVIVEAPDEQGKMQRWNVTWGAASQLNAKGVTREFFKPGDAVVITGNPGRNPAANILVMKSLHRPSDGYKWGDRPGEVVD
jgi:hypothetical protein